MELLQEMILSFCLNVMQGINGFNCKLNEFLKWFIGGLKADAIYISVFYAFNQIVRSIYEILQIVSQCNEAANRCEQAYEMETLSKQIEFPANISPFPLVPLVITQGMRLSRTLVRRGEMTHLIWRGDDAKLTFGKKFTKSNIYCFLFTDMLVLTKKKGWVAIGFSSNEFSSKFDFFNFEF